MGEGTGILHPLLHLCSSTISSGYPKLFIAHPRPRRHRQESFYKKRLSTTIRITSLHILTAIVYTAYGMRYKMIYIALIACVTEKITVLCMTM